MSDQAPIRGGSPVAQIDAMPAAEARLIRYLRAWCDGEKGQARVLDELSCAFGTEGARHEVTAFSELMTLIARYGRRPLTRHHSTCLRVGSDEAVFANFVMTAATGEREDAMMVASLLVRGDLICPLVGAAQRVGLTVARLALGAKDTPAASVTRH